jgi:hypothetical protein
LCAQLQAFAAKMKRYSGGSVAVADLAVLIKDKIIYCKNE